MKSDYAVIITWRGCQLLSLVYEDRPLRNLTVRSCEYVTIIVITVKITMLNNAMKDL